MKDYRFLQNKYMVSTYSDRGLTIVRGEGCCLQDIEGNKYLDLMGNYGVNIFGYDNPQITRGLQEQLEILPNLHGSFANDTRAKAASELVKRGGGGLSKVYFANSGSEAVEAALKFVVQATSKKEIIAMEGSFHGKTIGALSVTTGAKYRESLEDLLWDVNFVTYGDIKSLEKAINKNTAAVILEPIQGESGVIVPAKGYLKAVEELCRKKKVLLILDEIQTGAGRTGTFLACQGEKVEPDIVCLGKGLAGGIPVGATLVSEEIADKIPKLSQTSTFGGNPLACRGILEVFDLLDDKALIDIGSLGDVFVSRLRTLKSKRIKEIRGRGLMIGLEVTGNRNQILKDLQKNRILACPAGDNVIRFLPPYIITEKEIDRVIEIMAKVL